MFSIGSKVVLFRSSHQKSIGPKKGSIGYVSNNVGTAIHQEYEIISAVCDMYFTRYGFEEKNRSERKTVIALFPYITEQDTTASKEIQSIYDRIDLQSKNSTIGDSIRKYYGIAPHMPLVMAAPVIDNVVDLTTCSKLEFMSWAGAFLSSFKIINFIDDVLCSCHYTLSNDSTIGDKKAWETVRSAMAEKESKDDYIGSVTSTIDNRRKFIKLHRLILSMYYRCLINKVRKKHDNLLIANPFVGIQNIYDDITEYLFNRTIFREFVSRCKNFNDKYKIRIVEHIRDVVDEYIDISNRTCL